MTQKEKVLAGLRSIRLDIETAEAFADTNGWTSVMWILLEISRTASKTILLGTGINGGTKE